MSQNDAPDAAPVMSRLDRLGSEVEHDRSGVVGLLVLLAVGTLSSYVLWPLFAQPLSIVSDVLPTKTCSNETVGTTGMRLCGAQAGLIKMIGPLGLGVAIFFARKPLTRWTQALAKRLPTGLRPLVAPLLAIALFLLVWAGTHSESADQSGLLPQKAFPVLIGAYTYAVMQWGPSLQDRMSGFLDVRDRLPFAARLVITLAVPTLVSLVVTNQERVSNPALKEQVVVVIGLALAYLLLVPRSVDVAAASARLMGDEPK